MPVSFAQLAVSTCVILSFIVLNIQQSKNGFVTLEIYQMRSVSTFQRCTIWLPCGLHNTLMLCMTDYWICDTLQWKTAVLSCGPWELGSPWAQQRAMFGVRLQPVKEEITLFEFNYIPLIYWTPINKHTSRGRAILREGFSFSLFPHLFSRLCSLHFIINWHKPFFEVQEPSRGMTAQQTMNKTQKRQWALFEYSSEPP